MNQKIHWFSVLSMLWMKWCSVGEKRPLVAKQHLFKCQKWKGRQATGITSKQSFCFQKCQINCFLVKEEAFFSFLGTQQISLNILFRKYLRLRDRAQLGGQEKYFNLTTFNKELYITISENFNWNFA